MLRNNEHLNMASITPNQNPTSAEITIFSIRKPKLAEIIVISINFPPQSTEAFTATKIQRLVRNGIKYFDFLSKKTSNGTVASC